MGEAIVRSSLAKVSIAEVERSRSKFEAQAFGEAERAELRGRRAQTVAGFLALKRALSALFEGMSGGTALTERDIVLTHRENGAPSWAPSPVWLARRLKPLPVVQVSVSHTREWAYALAVCVESADG